MGRPVRVRPRDVPPADTWWSRRFLAALASFADPGALERGRALRGAVLRLDVRAYEVEALVRGPREEPYRVTLGVPEIEGWEEIEAELARRPVVRARVVGGELPHEALEVFAACGVPLFPECADDLHLMCDCPAWTEVCEHAAAALSALAAAFDDDPFLVTAWNGRTSAELRTALRRRPAEAGADTGAEPVPAAPPLPVADFWTPPSGLAALRGATPPPPVPPGLLLRLLDPPDVKVRRRALTDVLAPLYLALAADGVSEDEC